MATEGGVTFLVVIWLGWLGLAGGSPAATHFAFASPKESKQRKGDPTVCDPSLRYGHPAVLSPAGGLVQTRLRLKQARALIRLDFRSSAHTEGVGQGENQYQQPNMQSAPCAFCSPIPLPKPVLAGPVLRQESGIRAARCLSRRRVCADPRFAGAAQVAP